MVKDRPDPSIKRANAIQLVAQQFVIEHIEIFGDAHGEDGFWDDRDASRNGRVGTDRLRAAARQPR